METKYFECSCNSSEHTIRMVYDPEEKDAYVEVQLCMTNNFFQRVWSAFKYVFGYNCRYGHWDCTLIEKETAEQMIELLKKIE